MSHRDVGRKDAVGHANAVGHGDDVGRKDRGMGRI